MCFDVPFLTHNLQFIPDLAQMIASLKSLERITFHPLCTYLFLGWKIHFSLSECRHFKTSGRALCYLMNLPAQTEALYTEVK